MRDAIPDPALTGAGAGTGDSPAATELVVCTTCRLPGKPPEEIRDGARLSAALAECGVAHRRQECLSACDRGCAVVFRGPGRWTYVQGALDPDRDLNDLLLMIRAYALTPDGVVPWRQRPEIIRKNTIARIPPMEASHEP